MKAWTLLVALVLGAVATVANAAWPDRPIHLIRRAAVPTCWRV